MLTDILSADIIDTRDMVTLEEELIEALDLTPEDLESEFGQSREEILDELGVIKTARNNIEDYSGDSFDGGVQLIAESYFDKYAEEFADDIGAYEGSKVDWPMTHIDWKAAAEELQMDYTTVEINGTTYLFQ